MRFSYVKYDKISQDKQQVFKEMFERIESYAEAVLKDSRPKSLLLTSLEEAYMWTGKAIRDEQIERDGTEVEQVERSCE